MTECSNKLSTKSAQGTDVYIMYSITMAITSNFTITIIIKITAKMKVIDYINYMIRSQCNYDCNRDDRSIFFLIPCLEYL